MDIKSTEKVNVLIFALRVSTLVIFLLSLEEWIIKVKATNGSIHLWREDFNIRLVEYYSTKAFNQFCKEDKRKYYKKEIKIEIKYRKIEKFLL